MGSFSLVIAEEEKTAYIYNSAGEIRGYETENYMFTKEGDLIGYKVRDDQHIYIYSPTGDRIGYKKRITKGDHQYVYDEKGEIVGYYSGVGEVKASPLLPRLHK